MTDDTERHWSVDKRVPLALIVTIVLQTGAGIWWMSNQNAIVVGMGQKIAALENQRAGERLAVLESTAGDIRGQLNRIESKLDRYSDSAKPHP